ncbi:hypothetical protein ABBQ32_006793 [Trebouxia sp. C0010 RCD-2024]
MFQAVSQADTEAFKDIDQPHNYFKDIIVPPAQHNLAQPDYGLAAWQKKIDAV